MHQRRVIRIARFIQVSLGLATYEVVETGVKTRIGIVWKIE